MKNKKFLIMCIFGVIWASIFLGMLFGLKVNPKFEELIMFICFGWFAFWTISESGELFKNTSLNKQNNEPPKKQNKNAK